MLKRDRTNSMYNEWLSYKQIRLYLRLKSKTYFRLWKEFPWIIRIIILGGIVILFYLLIISHLGTSLMNYIITVGVFIILGLNLCRLNASEAILLKVLRISQIQIRLFRCLLLSIPFFLLDIYAGGFSLILGTSLILLVSDKKTKKTTVPAIYKKTSYQWLSMFRAEGRWLLLSGLLFLIIALIHENRNMACVSLGWIFLLPCLTAYYRQKDPRQWLWVYRDASFLLRKKIIEVLQNTIILLLVCVPLILVFDLSAYYLYIKLFLSLIVCNVLLFYGYYACYPGMLTAMVLTGISVFLLSLLYIINAVYLIPVSLLLLMALHMLSNRNLKSTIYGTTETAD